MHEIVKNYGVCGGEACFRHSRIPVWSVIRAFQLGISEASLLSSYPSLTVEKLAHAHDYARTNWKEIARAIAENERK
jgi:uncharacterized protein (DUF433 family)